MDWTDHYEALTKEIEETLEPEPIARCATCGGSLYLVDHDDNGTCDGCWEKMEKVSFDESERRQRELARRGLE